MKVRVIMSYIRLSNVQKVYKMGELTIPALENASFEIEKGEFAVVVGPSGAGKTTLLNLLGGMDSCTGGEIDVDGSAVSGYNRRQLTEYRRHDIGFVFQFYNLVQNLTALENVELATEIARDPLPPEQVLRDVGLADRMQNFPAQLSGGEQQRVAIARALATDPEIIFFDEPTSALDPELIGEVLGVMRKLADEGMTMLVVTHEMGFAKNVSSKVIFMDGGVVLEEGSSAEFFSNPHGERTREFLRTILERDEENSSVTETPTEGKE